jgi:hypothetical protein
MVSSHPIAPNTLRADKGYSESPGATGPEFFLMRAGEELMDMIPSREVSLAKTKVDEAVMWLERARRNQSPPAATPILTANDV